MRKEEPKSWDVRKGTKKGRILLANIKGQRFKEDPSQHGCNERILFMGYTSLCLLNLRC